MASAVRKKGAPGAGAGADDDGVMLLRVYGVLWCLHQLVPFVDALIRAFLSSPAGAGLLSWAAGGGAPAAVGFAAMDNRMLSRVDFYTRLPAVLLSLAALARLPRGGGAAVALLSIAHVINIASWWFWMPRYAPARGAPREPARGPDGPTRAAERAAAARPRPRPRRAAASGTTWCGARSSRPASCSWRRAAAGRRRSAGGTRA